MATRTEESPALGKLDSSAGRLPVYLNPLVGREKEMALIRRALLDDQIRLLTVAGPAGIGKTRLALEAAQGVSTQFRDGVWFVDLARIDDLDAAPWAMLEALSVQSHIGHSPLAALHQHLQDRHLLIVFDTFEHILPAAPLVGDLLATHPGLSVLVTSQQPLRLRWEHAMAVAPLSIPLLAAEQEVDALLEFSSVQLFLQRARATRLDFTVTPENAREIASICAQVDGMPLAIELAASWVSLLTPSAILEYLREHSFFPHSRMRDVPARQRSLEAALAWSYDLLNPSEQTLFRRLSVCVSEFSLDAAAAIAGDTGLDILEALSGLVDKNLLESDFAVDDEPRFRLRDASHSYGLERLADSGELEETQRRHARYYVSVAEQAETPLRHVGLFFAPRTPAPPQSEWRPVRELSFLDRDYPILLAALTWAQNAGDAHLELRLAYALAPYWRVRAISRDGAHWLEDALGRYTEADSTLRARVLNEAGLLVRQEGGLVRATQLIQEAVSLARTIDEPSLLGEALINLAAVPVLVSEAEVPAARSLIQEAGAIFKDIDDEWGSAIAALHLAFLEVIEGHGHPAEAILARALVTLEELGDGRTLAVASYLLAHAVGLQGDQARARSQLETCLRLCRNQDDRQLTGATIDLAAWLDRDEYPRRAATLIGASDALRIDGFSRSPYERYLYTQTMERLRDRLDEQVLIAARNEGGSWPLHEILDRVVAISEWTEPPHMQTSPQTESGLGDRELEVLRLMSEGMSNNQIAATIFVSAGTVKLDIRSVYRKLASSNRAQAIAIAAERGLI